jgi:hypothetical protein
VHSPGQADGFHPRARAEHVLASTAGIALVEDQLQHVQHRAQTGGALIRRPHSNGTPNALVRCSARLTRWGHCGLGHHEGVGHLRLVTPPTAGRGQATAEAGSARGGNSGPAGPGCRLPPARRQPELWGRVRPKAGAGAPTPPKTSTTGSSQLYRELPPMTPGGFIVGGQTIRRALVTR